MTTKTDDFQIQFKADQGTAQELTWRTADGGDVLKLGGYGGPHAAAFPKQMEWQDLKTKFRIRLNFLNPSISIAPAEEEGEEDAHP